MSLKITFYDSAYETFAVQSLAATLKAKGFNADIYLDLSMSMDDLGEGFFLTPLFSLQPEEVAIRILAGKPDVIGFSIMTIYYGQLSAIIHAIKVQSPQTVVIAGGPHPTLVPRETLANREIDFIFVGEADHSLPSFLEDLERFGMEPLKQRTPVEMPGVWNVHQDEIIDRHFGQFQAVLDELPFFYKDDHFRANPALRYVYTITCNRGCIYACTYCNSSTMRKMYHENGQKYYRSRSVDHVIAELKMAVVKYNPSYIMFLDNVFAPNISWLREFGEKYTREIQLPFYCEANPASYTLESIDIIAKAGCAVLQFGFQSANEEVRRTILKRRETNDRIRELVSRAKQHRILVCVDHIANLPGEEEQHLDEAINFYREIRPHWVNLAFLQYYPRADIIEIGLSRRHITQDELSNIIQGKSQGSIRLVSDGTLVDSYRVLPMRFFSAFKLNSKLSVFLDPYLKKPFVYRFLSPLASLFIYASRILYALTNRKDFLIRHHLQRNWYVVKNMLLTKWGYNG
ncbi:MAG: B12-binding domain-containing radical SAM protein [Magnetococcales bacterium]|nr:B12-binding domain-containing radical SAM protein [Magnetococcales bacterium]